MTVSLAPYLMDDDDDSLYNEDSLPSPARPRASDTILDESDVAVRQLDRVLDDEEDSYVQQQQQQPDGDDAEDGVVVSNSGAELGHVEILDVDYAADTADVREVIADDPVMFDDDIRFDSDEQADVESLTLSDDDDDHLHQYPNAHPSKHTAHVTSPVTFDARGDVASSSSAVTPQSPVSAAVPSSSLSTSTTTTTTTTMTHEQTHAQAPQPPQPPQPSSRRHAGSGVSLLSRASHTFYKTFLKRKPSSAASADRYGTANDLTSVDVSQRASASTSHAPTNIGREEEAGVNAEDDDRLERLCRLLDAQLSALAGAKTGFVQLGLLRPLAEQTLHAVSVDARLLLLRYGAAEADAERACSEAERVRRRGEEEVARKERMLIEAKVALAEACGDVERLRGELAAAKRVLADPARKSRGLRRKMGKMREEVTACREVRSAVEGKLEERRRSVGREKAELGRLEKEYRDIEGDWT